MQFNNMMPQNRPRQTMGAVPPQNAMVRAGGESFNGQSPQNMPPMQMQNAMLANMQQLQGGQPPMGGPPVGTDVTGMMFPGMGPNPMQGGQPPQSPTFNPRQEFAGVGAKPAYEGRPPMEQKPMMNQPNEGEVSRRRRYGQALMGRKPKNPNMRQPGFGGGTGGVVPPGFGGGLA